MLANRGDVRGVPASVRAAATAPGFGNPIAFTIDDRCSYRTIAGRGFPRRGARVNVPATTYPKPRRPSASRRRPVLSKPAARPMGFARCIPASDVRRAGSVTAPPMRSHGSGSPSAVCAKERQPQRCVREVMDRLRRKGEQRAPHRPVQVHRYPPRGPHNARCARCAMSRGPYATRRCQTTSRAD